MHSGIYTAYSGLKAQMEVLDTLANNLANANTAGFKEQRSFLTTLNLAAEAGQNPPVQNAANLGVTVAGRTDFSPGSLSSTQRDLDVAIVGNGFLTVETPAGPRYTRSGNLQLDEKSVLSTSDGHPVLGEQGAIVLPQGKISINEQGDVSVDGLKVDRLKIASFENPTALICEGASLFAAPKGAAPATPDAKIRQGFLEASNVNPVMATVRMVETMRHFESIQKAITLMLNDMDAKAIEKLPR